MDLNKLRTFLLVAELGSISKAAEKLKRTQPAITQQMQLLENEIKIRLFDRKNTRIFLTSEGEDLYHFAFQRISELDAKLLRIHQSTQSQGGVIKLALLADQFYLLSPIIKEFEKSYPLVHFQFIFEDEEKIEYLLSKNEVDFGLLYNPKERKLIEHQLFIDEKVVLVSTEKYLNEAQEKLAKASIELSDLQHLNLIISNERFSNFSLYLKRFNKNVLIQIMKKDPYLIANHVMMLKDFTILGLGISVLPMRLIKEELESKKLIKVIFNSQDIPTRRNFLLRKKKRTFNYIKEEFYSFLSKFYH